MASKRSLIDATLKATGGSCEFTQDIEDNPEMYNNGYSEPSEQQEINKATNPPKNTRPRNVQNSTSDGDRDRADFENAMDGLRRMDSAKFKNALNIAGYNDVKDVPAEKRHDVFNIVNSAYNANGGK